MKIRADYKKKKISMRLLGSYLAIILVPAISIIIIYFTMSDALLEIQKERSQNLSNEAVVTFNKEIEQIDNVAQYIIKDKDLKNYLETTSTCESENCYFEAYLLAKSYPDYAILNQFIDDIYIFPLEASYFVRIPQVIPNDRRGMLSIDIEGLEMDYDQIVRYLYYLGKSGLVYDEEIADDFLIIQQFNYESGEKKSGVIVIKVKEEQIEELLSKSLGIDDGISFLVNEDDKILSLYDKYNGGGTQKEIADKTWQSYIWENTNFSDEATINQVQTDYNGWSIVTVIPNSELLSKIGTEKNLILFLCVFSVLFGVAICLRYWNKSQAVVERYTKYTEKYSQKEKKMLNIWNGFNSVFEDMDTLELTLDNQKQRAQEGLLYKILYGKYDSEEKLKQEMKKTGVSFQVNFPCILVGIEVENSIKQEPFVSSDMIEEVLREKMNELLPFSYLMVNINVQKYIVLVKTQDEMINEQELKTIFEQINYAFYCQLPVNMFIGISGKVDSFMAMSEEYEHVSRICEYAKYYKLRIPCLLGEIPKHQPLLFTIEFEMHLEKTIKSGTKEQMEAILDQIRENYFFISNVKYALDSYNLEILRCILLRSMKDINADERVQMLIEKIHKDKNVSEIEESIWKVWNYFKEQQVISLDQDMEVLKQKIDEKIETEYSNEDFNLAMVAEWLGMPEKKLYRDFKKMYGVSFASYLEMKRICYAQELLKEKRAIMEVAATVGYGSDISFRRAFKRVVGVSPSDYQRMQEA